MSTYQDAPLPPASTDGPARADILAGLHASEATTIGDETPEALLDRHDAAVRAAALAEAKAAVVQWLTKKSREYGSVGSRDREAHAVATMASKIDRGAVRLFLAHRGTPTGGDTA